MILASCGTLVTSSLTGTWYRALQPHFYGAALATAHTKTAPSRFNEGAAAWPPFEILYLAEDPQVALFEVQAILGSPTTPGAAVPNPRRPWVVINVAVVLQQVADLTRTSSQALLDTSAQELTGDWLGYSLRNPYTSVSVPAGPAPTQELGAALFSVPDLEAFQTVSARVPYSRNLVVFPTKLRAGSSITFTDPSSGASHRIP